jgi:predicted lipoprotein with Yx(FWY)xxD motif
METRRTRLATWGAAGMIAAAVLLTAACASSSSPASSSTSAPPAASGQATLQTGHTSAGTVLTDSKGMTLYTFAKDQGSTSACTGACASAWPPVTGTPVAASGVSLSGQLGTISRGGGVLQATYNGHPLYTFAGDTAAGQANGNGSTNFGGLWAVITIGAGSGGTPTSSSSGGYGY